jgi:hypothetical protein
MSTENMVSQGINKDREEVKKSGANKEGKSS